MNILMIPHNAGTTSMSLGDSVLILVGVGIVVWICRKIVEKWN